MNASTLPLSYAATANDLAKWAARIEQEIEKLQEVGRTPHEQRQLRTFRFSDVRPYMRSIGERRWQTWIQQNVMTPAEREASRDAEPGTLSPHRLTLAQVHAMMNHYGVRPSKPAGRQAMITAFAQFKGGSAKTTSCIHFAHYLALRGYRVLVIDMDPQGTLTRFLGINPQAVEDTETFMPAFIDPELGLKPRPTHVHSLDVLPATMSLNQIDIELAIRFKEQDREAHNFYGAVENAMVAIREQYDFVLLDTPPAFSLSQIALLWGVNSMIVPLPPEGPDLGGMADFLRQTAALVRTLEGWEGRTKVWAPFVVVHGRDKASPHAEIIKASVGTALAHHRLSHTIPDMRAISASQDLFKSVYEVIGTEVDLRQIKRAREAMDLVWSAIEEIFLAEWHRPVADAQ